MWSRVGGWQHLLRSSICSVPAILPAPAQPKLLLPPDFQKPFQPIGFFFFPSFFSHQQSCEHRRARLIKKTNSKANDGQKVSSEERAGGKGSGAGPGQHPARSALGATLLCILHQVFAAENNPFCFSNEDDFDGSLAPSPLFPFPFLFYFKFR